jgi:splicing factor U2AF 65 kDa subunit
VDDIRDECNKFGQVREVVVPRPARDGVAAAEPGVGKVYVSFATKEQCTAALQALAGRKFAQRIVAASFYAEDRFNRRDF